MASWPPVSYKNPEICSQGPSDGLYYKSRCLPKARHVGHLIFVILEILKIARRRTIPHRISRCSCRRRAPDLAPCTPHIHQAAFESGLARASTGPEPSGVFGV